MIKLVSSKSYKMGGQLPGVVGSDHRVHMLTELELIIIDKL